jgi:hypothetical protein
MIKENRTPNYNCKICNKHIYKRPYELKMGRVYCSHKCAQIPNTKELQKCFACNNSFVRNLRKKFCSKDCANCHTEHHHVEKSGTTEYIKIRNLVV